MRLPVQEINKIVIFRALQLGDMLCSIPAIRALRHAYPNAEITLAGLPWAKSLLNRFPQYFDAFIHFPGYPGLPEQEVRPVDFTAFLQEIQICKFDLALQMQGNGSIVNPMVELFNARFTVGFCTENDYHPSNGLFLSYPNYGSEIERHLLLMQHLEIPPRGSFLEFPLTSKDEDDLREAGLKDIPRYVCVHPGSRGAWRQWATEYFADLADRCAENGLTVVLTGTNEEMNIVNEVKNKMKHDSLVAAGKTSIGAAGVLIRDAVLLISNCTGVSHIASALKTPSLVISMDGEPERWAPLDKELHIVVDWTVNTDHSNVQRLLEELLRRETRVISEDQISR